MIVILTILVTYLLTTLFGHVVHWSLHKSWTGRFHESHMTHHLKLYPPDDFTSDIYRHPGKDSTLKMFAYAAIPMVLLPIILCCCKLIPLYLLITILITESIVGFLHDYIHDSLHIRNHWLYQIPFLNIIFVHWFYLHLTHHQNMNTNFGIFSFYWDKMFKTYNEHVDF